MSILESFEDKRRNTAQAFADPRPGMRFTEMYCFWLHVVEVRENGSIVAEEYVAPAIVPDEVRARIRFDSVDDFREKYSYRGQGSGYWVHYVGDDAPVEHVERLRDEPGWAKLWEGTSVAPKDSLTLRRRRARRAASRVTSEGST